MLAAVVGTLLVQRALAQPNGNVIHACMGERSGSVVLGGGVALGPDAGSLGNMLMVQSFPNADNAWTVTVLNNSASNNLD